MTYTYNICLLPVSLRTWIFVFSSICFCFCELLVNSSIFPDVFARYI